MTCPRFARAPFALAVGVALLALGCHSDAISPGGPRGPTYAVSDGAHEGNPDFFFLPPLFRNPVNELNYDAGEFNATLRPAVEICELGDPPADDPDGPRECAGPAIKRFEPSDVTVNAVDEHYQANWNTDETVLEVAKYYRINVLVGTERLGFADVDPVSSGKDLKSVETGEYIGLVDGRTLPIKFRIENGALCGTPESPCAAETINLSAGGEITLVTETERFEFVIDPNTTAEFGGVAVTDITFNLEAESCERLPLALPVFGDCVRITTFFTVEDGSPSGSELVLTAGTARLSLCVLEPVLDEAQEPLVTLHQKDGSLVRALPHVFPDCGTELTRNPTGFGQLASRGWQWVRGLAARLVTPATLHARSARRTAVFNLGGGGETDRFGSSCDGASSSAPVLGPTGIMMVDCPPSSAPVPVATATRVTARTSSDFQFALPAMMVYVNPDDASRTATEGSSLPTAVRILDWNSAAVAGATVTFSDATTGSLIGTALSNSDGIAEILWLIAEGENRIVASGFGIAGPNNYPEAQVQPFMPDISPGATQQAVALGTGRLEFSATGETPVVSGIYLIRDSDDMLQRLDPTTLTITNIGPLGIDYAFGDCAWNPSNRTFYMVEGRGSNSLYTVDLSTGAATAVGAHGITDLFAVGYHPPTNRLYAVAATAGNNLYSLDLTSGAATLIAPTGLGAAGSINGLAWDATRGQFVALVSNVGGGTLYQLDVTNAAVTTLGTAGPIDNAGLTYDPTIDRFWAAEFKGEILQYDPAEGFARETILTGTGQHTCIAVVP